MENLLLITLNNAISLAETSAGSNSLIIAKNCIKKQRRLAVLACRYENKRRILKIKRFYKSIPSMQNDVFYSHFRMEKSTFKTLLNMLRPYWVPKSTGRIGVSLEKALYATLWKLSRNASFRDVSNRFDMAMGTSYKICIKTIKTICCLKKDVIKFPTTVAEQKQKCDEFSAKHSQPFPNVIGCIDVMHISISQPVKDSLSFYNSTGNYSVVLQAIVDGNFKFMDVFIGCPGRCHDAAIWEMSPIRKSIVKGELKICSGCHLLGDSTYPLESFLMVPYKDNGSLTPKQIKYNKILCSTRAHVEQAFGILKKKFRILKYIDVHQAHLPKTFTLACIILHNIIIENEGHEACVISEEEGDEAFNSENSFSQLPTASQQREEAKNKRDAIVTLLTT
ncbi:protein ALP1-like isoform X1 [Bactrocera tryoni]|uniref:protein ALP1-like isoform X1 n=2 Tax=Bactrocera tryoni TaxID=59916 RepID=UPI001A98AD23|nr:protein ALP1-like isoform X1 [Bactrocera tryoni]